MRKCVINISVHREWHQDCRARVYARRRLHTFLDLRSCSVLICYFIGQSICVYLSMLTRDLLQFFALQLVQNLAMTLGPIAHYYENSRYYSAVPPRPNKEVDAALPHITIQMPVYKEGLDAVLWVLLRIRSRTA